MKRNALVTILAGVAVAVAAWNFVPAGTGAPAPSAPTITPGVATRNVASAPATQAAPAAAGYIVHLDGTGKMTTEPQTVSDADFNAEMAKMINTSSDGLQQVTLPSGAVKMDLQGRFQSAMVASKDADGKVVIPCLTNENDVKGFEKSGTADAARKE